MAAVSVRHLELDILEAVDTLGIIDRLLGSIARFLNRRAVESMELTVRQLEQHLRVLEATPAAIIEHIKAIDAKINDLEDERGQIKASDFLTLGLGWIARQIALGGRQSALELDLDRYDKKLAMLNTRADRVFRRIADLEERLERIEQEPNPSLLARIIRCLQLVKNIIVAITSVIAGKLVLTVSSVVGAYQAASALSGGTSQYAHRGRRSTLSRDSRGFDDGLVRCETCGRPTRLRDYGSCRTCIRRAQSEALRILSSGKKPKQVMPALREVARETVQGLPRFLRD